MPDLSAVRLSTELGYPDLSEQWFSLSGPAGLPGRTSSIRSPRARARMTRPEAQQRCARRWCRAMTVEEFNRGSRAEDGAMESGSSRRPAWSGK